MKNLPITPARVFTTAGLAIATIYPGASENLRLIVGGALVGAYVIGATVVEAVKQHKSPGYTVEAAVKNAVYAIRTEDAKRASR